MEPNNQSKKYNPFKDESFWTAFLLGGGVSVPLMALSGLFSKSSVFITATLLNLIFLISWTSWVIFKKGKKGSLLIGFLIALFITAICFFPLMRIEIMRAENQHLEFMEKYVEENMNAEQRKFFEENKEIFQ